MFFKHNDSIVSDLATRFSTIEVTRNIARSNPLLLFFKAGLEENAAFPSIVSVRSFYTPGEIKRKGINLPRLINCGSDENIIIAGLRLLPTMVRPPSINSASFYDRVMIHFFRPINHSVSYQPL